MLPRSPDATDAVARLHAVAQAHFGRAQRSHAPGLFPARRLPEAIGAAWRPLAPAFDHALLCPAFSFVLHAAGVILLEGVGRTIPPKSLLPAQGDPDAVALCRRGLDALAPTGILYLNPHPSSGHERLLLANLLVPKTAEHGHLIRSGRVCALFAFHHATGRFRLSAAAVA